MIFTIQLSIADTCDIDLATIDIDKEDRQFAEDAFICEMKYNDFDMII